MGYFRKSENKQKKRAIIDPIFEWPMYLRRHEITCSEIIKSCITGMVQGMRPEKLELVSKVASLPAQFPVELKI
jgi:hypothetical protein